MKKIDFKSIFNQDNIGIIIGIVLVSIATIVLIWYYFGDNIANTFSRSSDPREKAIQMAYKEFKKIGEKGLKKEEFKVININKDKVESFYISSPENSIEIRKDDLKITRLNGVKTEK